MLYLKGKSVFSKLFLFSLVLVFIFLGLAAPKVTYADSWDWLANALAWPVYGLAWLLGELLSVVIYFLITVAQYNDFIDAEPVKQGWVIVRDLCNMFFVIVLLAIAFGTVLKIETYHYKRLLPKFLLMAILINFSKTIAGLLIDFSQIITLTFVAGFSSIAGGNLVTALHIKDYLSFDPNAPDYSKNSLQTFGAAVLALITVTISLIVVVIITIIFVFRIVALWLLVILSPLAYLLSIVPTGQRYASQWWQTFTKYIIVGPVLAFFLWLSLTTSVTVQDKIAQIKPAGLGEKPTATITKMGTVENMGGFIIGICLLVGSLVAATQMGAAGGKIAGDWAGRIQRTGVNIPKRIGRGLADIGIGAINRPIVKEGLARVVSMRGLGGVVASVTGARSLATRAYTGLSARERALEEQAQKYVGSMRDTRILNRLANQKGFTPWRAAVRDAAQVKIPSVIGAPPGSQIGDITKIEKRLATMSEEQLRRISDPEWRALGQSGADLTGRAETYARRHRDELGAYNLGRNLGGHAQIEAVDRDGNVLPGNFGRAVPVTPNEIGRVLRQRVTGGEDYSNRYRKVEDEKIKSKGTGTLSVGEFSRGQSSTVAVDFDKLGVESLKEFKDEKYEDIRGVNVTHPEGIKQVADRMVNIINEELKKLETKSVKTAGEEKEIKNLRESKAKFVNPSEISNLNLLNSSSRGYTLSELKKSKIHEELHGYGVRSERDTERLTQNIIETKQYSNRKEMGATAQLIRAPEKSKTAEEVMQLEETEEETRQKERVEIRSAQEKLTPQTKGMINQISAAGSVNNLNESRRLAYLLLRLNKAILEQTTALGKMGRNLANLTNINPEKITPLEVNVITEKIKNQFSQKL